MLCILKYKLVTSACLSVFLDGSRLQQLGVFFSSSLSKAVLKLYPAVDKASSMSSACLRFYVIMMSSSLRLLMAVVSDMPEDNIDNTTSDLPPDNDVNQLQQVDRGSQAITVLLGRQHLEFTATNNVKATRISYITLSQIELHTDGPCRNYPERKWHHTNVEQ